MNTLSKDWIKTRGMAKVVATIGPASNTPQTIRKLIEAGLDVARVNFSHGSQQEHRRVISILRKEARRARRELAILTDLQGPKIRTNAFENGGMQIENGATVELTHSSAAGGHGVITTSFKPIVDAVQPGQRILIDDGLIELRVVEKRGDKARCLVVNGGLVKDHKGINIPETRLDIPSMTAKDVLDAKFALREGVDFLALSFVRQAEDIRVLRKLARREGRPQVNLVAKIEKPEALDDLDNILREADAIMVARGDLGVEIGSEKVPVLQKTIINRCLALEVPVITATQMLESMIHQPRPTRAEASDVANAIFDGTDAVMLSGETAAGEFPVEAVRTMRNIIRDAESHAGLAHFHVWRDGATADPGVVAFSIGREACDLARSVNAVALACLSHSGGAAIRLTSQRPMTPVYVFSDHLSTVRKTSLFRGATGFLLKTLPNSDRAFIVMEQELLARGLIAKGDHVVYTAGLPSRGRGSTNTIHVRRAE